LIQKKKDLRLTRLHSW